MKPSKTIMMALLLMASLLSGINGVFSVQALRFIKAAEVKSSTISGLTKENPTRSDLEKRVVASLNEHSSQPVVKALIDNHHIINKGVYDLTTQNAYSPRYEMIFNVLSALVVLMICFYAGFSILSEHRKESR